MSHVLWNESLKACDAAFEDLKFDASDVSGEVEAESEDEDDDEDECKKGSMDEVRVWQVARGCHFKSCR